MPPPAKAPAIKSGLGAPPYVVRNRPRKLLVVSNCQTFGVVNCMQATASGCLVDGITVAEFLALPEDAHALLSGYERIFAIPMAAERHAGTPLAGRFVPLPHLYFAAYHPDLLHDFVLGPGRRQIGGPCGNSAIVTAAFLHGLSAAETVRLFRRETYDALGYLDTWDGEKSRLLKRCRGAGYAGVEDDFYQWCAAGPFMHTANHPRLRCIMDYARDALRRAGIETLPARAETVVDNLLQGPIWPVYDEIAAQLSLRGSYRFKPGGTCYTLDLDEFVDASFAMFREAGGALDVSRFDQPVIDRMRALLA